MPMNIELFVSGCPLCKETENMVREVMGPKCTLKVYDLSKGFGIEKAERYSIRAVPTIIGNGRKMFEGIPEHESLMKCSIEHGCKGQLLK
jgi:uncharacterized ferredoxin-like protein